jgi:signal transduction histidine kinase
MKILLKLFFLVSLSGTIQAQVNEGYYKKTIDASRNSALNIASLDSLIQNIRNQKKEASNAISKDYLKTIKNFTLLINNYKNSSQDSIYKADALQLRGAEHFNNSDYLKAIEDHQLAAVYYKNLGDTEYLFYALSSIINIYSVNGFNQKTIKERNKLIKKKLAINYTRDLYLEYYKQSIVYEKLGSLNKQEICLLEAYTLFQNEKKGKDINNHAELLLTGSLSNYYSLEKNLLKAKFYLDKADNTFDKQKKKRKYTFVFLKAKANYFIGLEKYYKAKRFVEEAYLISKKEGLIKNVMESEKLLFEIYNKTGEKEKALIAYINYTKIKDSIFNTNKTNALLYYQALHETKHKENKIIAQKASILLLAKENKAKQRLLLFVSIGAAFLFIILYLYRNRQHALREKKMKEEYSINLLLSQEEERKRISKDLHDSLGQSLLLIKNKITATDNQKTIELVDNTIEEMRTISSTLHPFQLEAIGISNALNNLINQLEKSYEHTFIYGNIEELNNILHKDKEVHLFRIVQECLSNAIKHAKAASVKVSLNNKNKCIILTIKDNGIGFDVTKKDNSFKGLGLKTIKERVKLLNGTLKINSTSNEGTTITIQFPIK